MGYGLSAKRDRPYSLFAQADLVEEVARRRGLDEVALVTHDMGDTIGGELLARDLNGDLHVTIERRVLTNGSTTSSWHRCPRSSGCWKRCRIAGSHGGSRPRRSSRNGGWVGRSDPTPR